MLVSLVALALLKPEPLHVQGDYLAENGQPVVLRGVEIPGFDSSDGRYVFRSARIALEDWHANCIQIPVSQDRWFGRAELQTDRGDGYRTAVAEVVNLALNRNCYVIVSLQSSDAGEWGVNLGAHQSPDVNSLAFWKDFAVKYRGEPHVLFGLYKTSLHQSLQLEDSETKEGTLSYRAVGLMTLRDAVRKAGAKNVCVASPVFPAPPGAVMSQPNHLWDPQGRGILGEVEGVDHATDRAYPLLFDINSHPSDIADSLKQRGASWIAEGFSPDSKSNLISDWLYTPTPDWGVPVKQGLAGS